MARLVYNQIELQDLRTYSVQIEDEYDPMAGVDKMRTHIVMDVAGVFNPVSTASFTQPGSAPASSATAPESHWPISVKP